MIDLTPLDVRNKRGDFKKLMRGYDPQEVDVFLELVAERLEALVRENIKLRDRTTTLQEQVQAQAGREQAVQDALVTAQELRKDIREQSQREADHIMREAESEARRMVAEAEAEARSRLRGVERQMDQSRDSLQELERRRQRFLQEFRGLLQRELDVVQVEEERVPLEDRTVDLELGGRRGRSSSTPAGAAAVDGADSDNALTDGVGEPDQRADGGTPDATADLTPVNVADLKPEEPTDQAATSATASSGSASSSPSVGNRPLSLELELMAGVGGEGTEVESSNYPDVPDLETVLAEAGIDELRPTAAEEISPPPAGQKPVDDDGRRPEDRLALFDKDEKKGKKG